MQRLLSGLDHPREAAARHSVAGTNGKGSRSHTLDARFWQRPACNRASMPRVPGAESTNAFRLGSGQVAARWSSDDEFSTALGSIGERVQCRRADQPFFENRRRRRRFGSVRAAPADLLLEVGPAGRLDATNVIETPLVSVIAARQHGPQPNFWATADGDCGRKKPPSSSAACRRFARSKSRGDGGDRSAGEGPARRRCMRPASSAHVNVEVRKAGLSGHRGLMDSGGGRGLFGPASVSTMPGLAIATLRAQQVFRIDPAAFDGRYRQCRMAGAHARLGVWRFGGAGAAGLRGLARWRTTIRGRRVVRGAWAISKKRVSRPLVVIVALMALRMPNGFSRQLRRAERPHTLRCRYRIATMRCR